MRVSGAAIGVAIAALAWAQPEPVYVPFSPGSVKGVLYRPAGGAAPRVGVLLLHRTANFLSHIGARELSRRGFLVLAMNPRSDNNEAAVVWEENALDVKSGVEYLRKQPGIAKVILFGHSGGGPAMSFYQAVAEQGVKYCQGPNKLTRCGPELANLPRADGIVFVDAHPGNSVNSLRSLHPGLVREDDPRGVDAALDPFAAANGYAARGSSRYTEDFRAKYFTAQAARMNRLIDAALAAQERMKKGEAPYRDDDVFLVVRGQGARLMDMDPSIHAGTTSPRKLLRNDGTIETKVIQGVRPPMRGSAAQNAAFLTGTRLLTLRSFLSANAIRAKDSMDGIDWCSSNNSTPCALQSISAPVLITAMGAHYFIRDNEIHYEMAASKDKDFVVIEGATHGVTPCAACETAPGQYANSVKNWADYVATWIRARY